VTGQPYEDEPRLSVSAWLWQHRLLTSAVGLFAVLASCCVGAQIFAGTKRQTGDPAEAADCFKFSDFVGAQPRDELPDDVRDLVDPVGCALRHHFEAYRTGRFTGADAAADAPPTSVAALRTCAAGASDFLGGDRAAARVDFSIVTPSEDGWDRGARWFRCVMAETADADGEPVERDGSLRGSPATTS
jgi:Septum formation